MRRTTEATPEPGTSTGVTDAATTANGNGRDALIAAIEAENAEFAAWLERVKEYASRNGYSTIAKLPERAEEPPFDPAHFTVRGLTHKADALRQQHADDKNRIRDAAIKLRREGYISATTLNQALRYAGLKEYEAEFPVSGYIEVNWTEPQAGRGRLATRDELRRDITAAVEQFIRARAPQAVPSVRAGHVVVGEAA